MRVVVQIKPEIIRQEALINIFKENIKNLGGEVLKIDGATASIQIAQHLLPSLRGIPEVREVLGVDLSEEKKEVMQVANREVKVKPGLKLLGIGGGVIFIALLFYWLGSRNED